MITPCPGAATCAASDLFAQWPRKALTVLVLAAGIIAAPQLARSNDGTPLTENQVKAAFTFRFLSYVDWPPTRFPAPESPVIVGVIGSDEIFDIESRITTSRMLGNHSIVVKKLAPDDPLTDVHAVFLSSVDAQKLPLIVSRAQESSVLLVSDIEGALGSGAEIVLAKIDGKIRFMVDLDAASRANLRIGSGMLSVAVKVLGSP